MRTCTEFLPPPSPSIHPPNPIPGSPRDQLEEGGRRRKGEEERRTSIGGEALDDGRDVPLPLPLALGCGSTQSHGLIQPHDLERIPQGCTRDLYTPIIRIIVVVIIIIIVIIIIVVARE